MRALFKGRMKIRQKLVLGFMTVTALIGVAGYVSLYTSQKALQKSIGENSVSLSAEILDNIDRDIYNRIALLRVYAKDLAKSEELIRSNEEFSRLENIRDFIYARNKEWTSVSKETITPFMQDLIDNWLSKELRRGLELKDFYKSKFGYRLFGEIFVTNIYGANIAQTQKTTDYYQADELWWRQARKFGLYIGDVEYDKSAGVYSTDIAVRIDDEKGNFMGVIKAISNIEDMIIVVRALEPSGIPGEAKTREFKLVDKDGRLIYSTEEFKFLEKLPINLLSEFKKESSHRAYFIAEGDKPGEGEELFAHARSRGYKDFMGLGWILIVEHETKEIFAPVTRLKYTLLIIFLGAVVFALLIGLTLSHSISRPIIKLKNATLAITRGKLDAKVDISSKDEIGVLATSFNKMSASLKDLMQKEKELAAKAAASETDRKRAVELESAYTKLREAQDMLVQAEKLNAIGHLASGIAHEVRNPLGVISQGADYLEKKLSGKKKDVAKALATLKKNVKRADQIISSLLDFSKPASLDLKPENINSILENSLSLVRMKYKSGNIKIINEVGKYIPKVLADKNRLEQVFINIFLNAVQAMPKGGQIIIRTYAKMVEEIEEEMRKSESNYFKTGEKAVIVEVEDTGAGIPDKHIKKIFDPFYTTKGHAKGTGLGLSVSQNIIFMHKGLIHIKNKEGSGAKVTVILKIAKGE